jgi:hypothetical protein
MFKLLQSCFFNKKIIKSTGLESSEEVHINNVIEWQKQLSSNDNINLDTLSLSAVSNNQTLNYDILNNMKYNSEIVYNQLNINACTANSLSFIIRYWNVKNGKDPTNFTSNNPDFLNPSRYYIYYNSLAISDNLGKNLTNTNTYGVSVTMETVLFALDKYGAISEKNDYSINVNILGDYALNIIKDDKMPPYNILFNLDYNENNVKNQIKPNLLYYLLATSSINGINIPYPPYSFNTYLNIAKKIRYNYLGNSNYQFKDLTPFKNALMNGYPILYGVNLSKSFQTLNNNNYYLEIESNCEYIGGHAMVIVGWGSYNPKIPNKKYFKVLNSWGSNWCHSGFCYLSEEYITTNTISAYSVYFIK